MFLVIRVNHEYLKTYTLKKTRKARILTTRILFRKKTRTLPQEYFFKIAKKNTNTFTSNLYSFLFLMSRIYLRRLVLLICGIDVLNITLPQLPQTRTVPNPNAIYWSSLPWGLRRVAAY